MRGFTLKIHVLAITTLITCIMFFPISKLEAADRTAEFLNGQIYNNLISDADFIDTDSMTEQQIQDFLAANNSYLKDYKENCKTASRIIFEAANGLYDAAVGDWHHISINAQTGTVSPKVILVMLQKEQSLISTPTYNEYGIRYAMGYGCPDATGCTTATHLGFSEQVGWGAWQLRANFEGAKLGLDWWNTEFGAGNDSINYVGQTRIFTDYGTPYSVTYANAATASHYRYTPHVFDSAYNFWKLFSEYAWSSPASPAIENTCPPAPPPPPPRKAGDANSDNTVNIADLSLLGDTWGQNVTANTGADFNGDGVVNIADLSILGDNWGK